MFDNDCLNEYDNWYFWLIPFLKNSLKTEMWSLGLKKFDCKNPADTQLYYYTICSKYVLNKPFLTVLLSCFENIL